MLKRHTYTFALALVSLFFVAFSAHAQFAPGWGFGSFGSPYNYFGGGGGGSIGWGVPNGQSRFQMVPSYGGVPTVTMNNGAWGNFAGPGSAISLGAASVLGSMYGFPIGIPGYGALGGVSPWGFGNGFGGGFQFGGQLGGWSPIGMGGYGGYSLPGLYPSYGYNQCMFTYCGAAAGVGVYGNSGQYVDTGCFYSYCDRTRSSGRYGRGDDRAWYERPVVVPGAGEVGLPPNVPAVQEPGILIADVQKPAPPPPERKEPKEEKGPKQEVQAPKPDVPPAEPAPTTKTPEGLSEPKEPTDICADRYKRHLDGQSSTSNCYACMANGDDFEELRPIPINQTEPLADIAKEAEKKYSVASGARRFAAAYYQTCKVLEFDNIACSGQEVQGVVKQGATSHRTIESIEKIISSQQYLKEKCSGVDLKETCNDICTKAAVFGLGSSVGVKQTLKTQQLQIQPRGARSIFNKVTDRSAKHGNMGSLDCSETVSKMLMATGRRMWPRSPKMPDGNLSSYLMTTDKIYAAAQAKNTCFEAAIDTAIRPGDLIVRPLKNKSKPGHVVIVDRVFNDDPFGFKHPDLRDSDGKILCDKIEARYFKFDVWSVDGVGSRNLVKTPANDFFARVDLETAVGLLEIAKAQCKKANGGPTAIMTYKPTKPDDWPVAVVRHKGDNALCMHKDPSKISLDGEECAKNCGSDSP